MNTTELDFDTIKQNLKDYFKRTDSPFKDWDFEGSGLSYLLDILAYNTHYNALTAHVSVNETFLDTAQIRSNVVARAKELGYVPRSQSAARGNVDIFFARAPGSSVTDLTLPAGASFKSSTNNETYDFVTISDYQASYDDDTGGFTFLNVELVEGELNHKTYTVDGSKVYQRYLIDDINVDTSTIRVFIRESASVTDSVPYVSHREFEQSTFDGESKVYFLSERYDGKYQIEFGDNIIGRRLKNLNAIDIFYITSNGSEANGARSFAFINANSNDFNNAVDDYSIVRESAALGGDSHEDIDSIRLNAPLYYASQDRAVSESDYRALINEKLTGLDALTVWGGQYNTPPVYGKVFISAKPKDALYLNDSQKVDVIDYLKKKNVVTVTPEFVDPDYIFLYFDIFFRYNKLASTLNKTQLETAVRTTVTEFNSSVLQDFKRTFRYSSFLSAIDDTSSAILNSIARLYLYKEILIQKTNRQAYIVNFKVPPLLLDDKYITTSPWRFNNQLLYIGDKEIVNSSNLRKLFVYRLSNDGKQRITVIDDVGTLDVLSGTLTIDPLPIDVDSVIRINIVPNTYDIVSSQNQLLSIDTGKTKITGTADSLTNVRYSLFA